MTKWVRTIPKPAVLILCVPVSFFLALTKADAILVFLVTAVAILGLISLIAKSTGQISLYSGPVVGGLLNATFGNFTELVIAFFAVQQGLHTLVRASLTGSILGNLLLVMGLSMFFGGLKYPHQRFSQTGANAAILMLVVALVALVIPSLVHYAYRLDPTMDAATAEALVNHFSIWASALLLVMYGLHLVFSLKSHRFAYMPKLADTEQPEWRKGVAFVVLCGTALLVTFESDVFVEAIKELLYVRQIGWSELFLGVVVVAAIGNAVDGAVAIVMARKDKMDLSFQVAMGASIQVALLIAPILVLYSFLIAKPLTLVFNVFELIALWGGVTIAGYSLLDGESNWFEGATFVGIYLMIAMVFFFHP